MATEIVMPRLSDTMDTGTVAKWLKQEGDAVKRGEIIAEIETDKANMELESYASGILARIVVGEGQSASLGQPIALIAKDADEAKGLSSGGDAKESKTAERSGPSAQAQTPESQAAVPVGEAPSGGDSSPNGSAAQSPLSDGHGAQGQAAPGGRVKASPLARRLAKEHDLDLSAISGTGPGGRITKDDVQSYLESAPAGTPAGEQPAQEPAQAPEQAPVERQPAVATGRGGQPVEMSRMQNTIARRMTEARFSAPDFVLTSEIDMTEARTLLKSIAAVEGAPKVGPNDLLIRAVALALAQHREVNAGWEGGTMVQYGRVNVGFAVTIPGGLVVPVVRDADRKSLGQIASETKPLIEKARGGKLAPSDYEDGTFSISNLGMYGIDQFTPIINVPEACILGVGSITPKPVVVDGEIVVRDRMRVNLACDHRVVNGAQGAEFLQTVRRLLEHPMLALL